MPDGKRFGIGDIESGTRDGARRQGADQRVGVYEAAPRNVDQPRGRLHRGQLLRADQLLGVRCGRCRDHEMVCERPDFVDSLYWEGFDCAGDGTSAAIDGQRLSAERREHRDEARPIPPAPMMPIVAPRSVPRCG